MEPYGLRLRQRIIELYEQEQSTEQIASVLGTSRSGTRRIRQHLRERGTIEPRPGGRGGRRPNEAHQQMLRELVAREPDATLAELRTKLHGDDKTGPLLSIATVDRWCNRLGLRLKKSRIAPRSKTVTT